MSFWRANGLILSAAVIGPIVLGLLVAHDRSHEERLPAANTLYLPADGVLLVASGPLNAIWTTAQGNVSRVASGSTDLGKLLRDVGRGLGEACETVSTVDDLRDIGIDTLRGVQLGVSGAPLHSANVSADNVVVALPVHDRSRLLEFLSNLTFGRGTSITLTGARSDEPAKAVRLVAVEARGARLCTSDGRAVRTGSEITASDGRVVLTVRAPAAAEGEIAISCRAILASGEETDCRCEADNADSSSMCTVKIASVGEAPAIDPDASQRARHEVIRMEHLLLAFPDSKTVLAAIDARALGAAIHHSRIPELVVDRARRLSAATRLLNSGKPNAGWLIAELRVPDLVLSGSISFALLMEQTGADLRIRSTIDPWGSRLLRMLVEPQTVFPNAIPEGVPGLVVSQGRATTEAVRYLLDWVLDPQRGRDGKTSDLADAVRLIAAERANDPGAIRFMFLGLRETLPDFVIAAEFPRTSADRIVRMLQQSFRIRRDKAILNRALAKLPQDSPDGAVPIDALIKSGALAAEPSAPWNFFEVHDGQVSLPSSLPAQIFESEEYRLPGNPEIRFLLPRVTDNDIELLDADLRDSEREALKAGAYRLASGYLSDQQLLVIGRDAQSVQALLAGGKMPTPSARAGSISRAAGGSEAEVVVYGLPAILSSLFRTHPNRDVRRIAGIAFDDLAIFETLIVTLTPDSDGRSLRVRVVASR